jgi:ATP-binding cassette subfamily F protein 3
MALLTVANVKHQYGTRIILDGATLSIDDGEKIGFVGRNGSGKTTLMRILRGDLVPDSGSVQVARNARVGYLSQHPDLPTDLTVREAAGMAFKELFDLHRSLDAVYESMATAEGDELGKLLKQQVRLESAMEAAGGYAIDHRIDAMLHGLGFVDEQFSQNVGSLSGGQKGRLGLARLLLEAPDLLLLDEPTNHLDINGRQWLENFLADEYDGAVLVVSHDRWLLDRVVSRIVEVERGVIREYPGNYHKYIELRNERQMTQARVYDKQRDKIRQEEAFIRKFKAGQRSKQARGRETRLDRFKENELVERPIELGVMRLTLPRGNRSGDMVVKAEDISKSYGDLLLFHDLDVTIGRGDRIGILGPNGVGKTTLVRCLLGDIEPDAGTVRHGSRLSVGYFRQTQEHLDLSLTVWQYLQSVIVSLDSANARPTEQQARDLAGAFLFSGAEQDKLLADLSGGERSRAVLAGLVAGAHNLIVLDEPTNHLDIPSAERLEQALSSESGYDGTMLLISHDRALLDAVCDSLIIFEDDGRVTFFAGGYSDWLTKLSEDALVRDAERAASALEERRSARAEKTATKLAEERTSARRSELPSATCAYAAWSLRKLEDRIESIELRVREIDESLGDPAVYTDGEACKRLAQERQGLVGERGPLEEEWGRRAEG